MLDYMNFIVLQVREDVGEDKAALIVMDNFKGQVTHSMMLYSSSMERNWMT